MARRPNVITNPQREARQRLVDAAPLVGTYPGVEEAHVEMKFVDPEGRQNPSPRGATYESGMRAYFYFSCPMRDCAGGGFDANDDLQHALTKRRTGHTGTLSCEGVRARSGLKDARCNIQLHYTLALRGKATAAA